MYNVIEIQKAFAELVGFYQPVDPQYPKIDTDLTNSTSGKYVQRSHSLCTVENIYNSAPEFKSFVYPAYSGDEVYIIGDIVTYSAKIYEFTGSTPGEGNPDVNDSWEIYNPFSAWLRTLYKNACSNLISKLLEVKKVANAGKSILDSQQLYRGFGMLVDKIIKRDRLVGLQIYTSRNENTTIYITRLGFQVDTEQTIDFYLYHSSQVAPIKVIPFEITEASSFAWLDVTDVVLGYMNANQNSNGVFYLAYYESDLQGQAIRKKMNFSIAPCFTCDNFDVMSYNAWSKYTAIQTFYVESDGLQEDKTLFDVSKIKYVYDNNYGINLSISVYCDMTKFFITNKMLFADALSKQVAIELLNEIAFSTRLNGIAATTKQLAGAELNPDPKTGSFLSQYNDGIKALNYDFSGFDANCLPCAKRTGISYETI